MNAGNAKDAGKNRISIGRSLNRLSHLVDESGLRLKKTDSPETSLPKPVENKKPLKETLPHPETDEEVFENAMNGVKQAAWRHSPHPSSQPPPLAFPNSEFEDRKLMESAIDEENPFPVTNHPEYIEGWIGVAGKLFLPNLRNGLYSIQGQIDLHGLNRIEAQIAVEDYIAQMSRFQSCCIKIIHGRGMNSPTARATLKEDLQRLLKTRRMSRYVIAFASAPSCDGGVGAVYVLLKRK